MVDANHVVFGEGMCEALRPPVVSLTRMRRSLEQAMNMLTT